MRPPPETAERRLREESAVPDDAHGGGIEARVTDGDAVPLGLVVADLLELSDLLDGQLRMRLAAYREGYQLGRQAGYTEGRRDEAAERDEAWNAIARVAARADPQAMGKRWSVRGELRTQGTFGQPHAADFRGRGAA